MTQPADPIGDNLVGPLLLALRDCLCAETQKTITGPVCRCYVSWDQGVPVMDGCSCECADSGRVGVGDAWVRFVSAAPNLGTGVGGAAVGGGGGWDVATCFIGWIVTIELGIIRCHPTPQDPRVPLAAQTNTDVALSRLSDFAAMRRAWTCCPALEDLASSPLLFTPLGPSGDCSGGTLSISVELSKKDRC